VPRTRSETFPAIAQRLRAAISLPQRLPIGGSGAREARRLSDSLVAAAMKRVLLALRIGEAVIICCSEVMRNEIDHTALPMTSERADEMARNMPRTVVER
jgi:hypothetical protein